MILDWCEKKLQWRFKKNKPCCYSQEVPKALSWLFVSIVEQRKDDINSLINSQTLETLGFQDTKNLERLIPSRVQGELYTLVSLMCILSFHYCSS